MQGNLYEVDIGSVLELIELWQGTGLLYVETSSGSNSSSNINDINCYASEVKTLVPTNTSECKPKAWLTFFHNGQIIYAFDSATGISRLEDYLFHYRIPEKPSQIKLTYKSTFISAEYAYLWELLDKNLLKTQQARSIVCASVYETLFDLFRLHQGRFFFETNTLLAPNLTTLRFSLVKNDLMRQLLTWRLMYPYIDSPEQFLVLNDTIKLGSKLPKSTIKKLQYWSEDKTSLRRLARFINKSVFSVAKAIYPYVLEGLVKLKYPNVGVSEAELKSETKNKRASIVCINSETDSTWTKTALSILTKENYEAIALKNPHEALGQIFKIQPSLILCDPDIPALNGYEICAMLRHSSKFSNLPIIMLLTKNEDFNYIKAKACGATDCLTKPLSSMELMSKVRKYV
ncbi:MAG: response regulator [Cyanobacteria bacterium P01_A01_bin.84]